jgi:hypothetical protein
MLIADTRNLLLGLKLLNTPTYCLSAGSLTGKGRNLLGFWLIDSSSGGRGSHNAQMGEHSSVKRVCRDDNIPEPSS